MTPLMDFNDAWMLAYKRVGHRVGDAYTNPAHLFTEAAALYREWARDSRNTPNGENDAIAEAQERRAQEFERFAQEARI